MVYHCIHSFFLFAFSSFSFFFSSFSSPFAPFHPECLILQFIHSTQEACRILYDSCKARCEQRIQRIPSLKKEEMWRREGHTSIFGSVYSCVRVRSHTHKHTVYVCERSLGTEGNGWQMFAISSRLLILLTAAGPKTLKEQASVVVECIRRNSSSISRSSKSNSRQLQEREKKWREWKEKQTPGRDFCRQIFLLSFSNQHQLLSFWLTHAFLSLFFWLVSSPSSSSLFHFIFFSNHISSLFHFSDPFDRTIRFANNSQTRSMQQMATAAGIQRAMATRIFLRIWIIIPK